MAVMFDTFKTVKYLRDSGFTEEQASGLTTTLTETQTASIEHLATKADLQAVKAELKEEFGRVNERITEEFGRVNERITIETGKINDRITRLEGKIDTFKAELTGKLEITDGKMRLYFIILLLIIIFTNPKSIELIARVLSLLK